MRQPDYPRDIYIPHSDAVADPTDIYNQVFSQLPVQDCRLERNFLTGWPELVAPEGEVFVIEGDFQLTTESNDQSYLMAPPIESQSLRAKNQQANPGDYEDDDDDDVVFGWYDPPLNFSGRAMRIFINGKAYGEPWYVKDFNRFKLPDAHVEVGVTGPVDAESSFGMFDYYWQDSNGKTRADYYTKPHSQINWSFQEAIGRMGHATISRVVDTSPAAEIKLPNYCPHDEEIWMPNASWMTLDNRARYFEAGLRRTLTQQERRAIMLEHRESGEPLADDPLKDLYIVQEGKSPKLLELIEIVKAAPPASESHRERMQRLDKKEKQQRRKERAARLGGTIAIISGGQSLSEAVRANAAPDWLEHELNDLQKQDGDISF